MARSLLTLALLVIGASPVVAQERFEGVFETDGMSMYVLSIGDGRYQGLFEVNDQRVPFEAKELWRIGLRGTYAGADGATVFEAVMVRGTMVLADPYQQYTLSRTAEVVPDRIAQAVLAGPSENTATHVSEEVGPPPQPSSPVVPAADPSTFEDPHRGFRFTAPTEWVGAVTDVGYAFQSELTTGTVLVLPHDLTSMSELRAEASAGFNDGSGTLALSGELRDFGSRGISGAFSGMIEGHEVRARVFSLLSSHGGGLTVLVVGLSSEFGEGHESVARSIATSVELFEPRAQDAANEWEEWLAGARLTYLYSYYSGGSPDGAYVGASEETKIDLCAAGHFYFGSSGSLSADGGGGAAYNVAGGQSSAQRGLGSWNVLMNSGEPTLHLSFHDGSTRDYVLTYDDEGKTRLNGQRYFRTYANSPVEDARPACP